MATQTFVTDLQAMNPTVVQVHQVNNNVSLPIPDCQVNPYLTNGFSHQYHLDGPIFICRHSTASHLGLFCLPMSHKRDDRLKFVNTCTSIVQVSICLPVPCVIWQCFKTKTY